MVALVARPASLSVEQCDSNHCIPNVDDVHQRLSEQSFPQQHQQYRSRHLVSNFIGTGKESIMAESPPFQLAANSFNVDVLDSM